MTAPTGPDRTGAAAGRKMLVRTATDTGYWLWCPACDDAHRISDGWAWNGDTERPTFTPSILVGGVWHYLGDCTHDKAGQSVPMVDLPGWMEADRG